MTSVVEEPPTNARRATYKRNQSKAKRVIFNSLKDHLMPVTTPLKTVKECFDSLTNLYDKKAPSQKRALKNKLRTLKMSKDDTIDSFFTKISQIRDQLTTIGVNVDDGDLVQTAVNDLPLSWETFLSSVNGHEMKINPTLRDSSMIVCKKKEYFKVEVVRQMKRMLLSLQE